MTPVFGRRARWLAGGLLAAGVVLHVVNAVSLDALTLLASGQSFVARLEDAAAQARPEYQDLALATLPSNPNNGAFTRLDAAFDGSAIADEATDSVDEYFMRWEFEDDALSSFVSTNASMSAQIHDGLLAVTQTDGAFLVNPEPLAIPVSDFSELVVRVRADSGNRFLLSWALAGKEALFADNQASLDLIADGEFHTYVVSLRRSLLRASEDLAGTVVTLAVTPSNVAGARVEIDYLRVRSRQWKYRQSPIGTSYETVGSETRPVLYIGSAQSQAFEVDIPAERPSLSFGGAALHGEDARLEVRVVADGESRALAGEAVSAARWTDWRLDLSEWRGRHVRIEFEAVGAASDVVFVSSPMVRSAPLRRANVVLIVEDTLRADHLSAYGYDRETAPRKAALFAQSGVVFTNAYSQATETRPSVPSLLTSLYPSATGVVDFSRSLSERYLTLAEVLRAQGYDTASFVQNPNAGLLAGLHQGFDRLVSLDAAQQSTEVMVGEDVLGWLDGVRDDNFFLYLHVKDPHGVYDPPPPFNRWYQEYEADSSAQRTAVEPSYLDPAWLDEPSAEARERLYDGEILHNDGVVGAFLEQLEQRGLLEDTLLVFTSDHGEWLGENDYWDHHPPGKRPVIHVPLMIRHPALLARPQQVDDVVQLVDVMPTILELVDIDARRLLLHGTSLASLMRGSPEEDWRDRLALSEEAVLMSDADPCTCGSVFFHGRQIHGSTYGSAADSAGALAGILPFLRTSVSRVGEDHNEARFVPDVLVRGLRQRIFSRAAAANHRFAQRLTAGESGDEYRMDPKVLEELRGLGYVR